MVPRPVEMPREMGTHHEEEYVMQAKHDLPKRGVFDYLLQSSGDEVPRTTEGSGLGVYQGAFALAMVAWLLLGCVAHTVSRDNDAQLMTLDARWSADTARTRLGFSQIPHESLSRRPRRHPPASAPRPTADTLAAGR
jgi:hypothetical protein